MNDNANDLAFPCAITSDTIGGAHGLTKREYIATQLMAGLLSSDPLAGHWELDAHSAVDAADALLEALKEKNNE